VLGRDARFDVLGEHRVAVSAAVGPGVRQVEEALVLERLAVAR